MSNKKFTIKVTGTPEQVNAFTDFLPVEAVEQTSGRYTSAEGKGLCHRYMTIIGEELFECFNTPQPKEMEVEA